MALASLVVGLWFRTMTTCTVADGGEVAIALERTGSMLAEALAGCMLYGLIVVARERMSTAMAMLTILFMRRVGTGS